MIELLEIVASFICPFIRWAMRVRVREDLGLEGGRGMYAVMNAFIGQCDWLSNIFTFGMIFLTKKKKSAYSENCVLAFQI